MARDVHCEVITVDGNWTFNASWMSDNLTYLASGPSSGVSWYIECSLVPRPRVPPGEKRSGERSQIPWAYYPKRVMTNEIARLVIIT